MNVSKEELKKALNKIAEGFDMKNRYRFNMIGCAICDLIWQNNKNVDIPCKLCILNISNKWFYGCLNFTKIKNYKTVSVRSEIEHDHSRMKKYNDNIRNWILNTAIPLVDKLPDEFFNGEFTKDKMKKFLRDNKIGYVLKR